MRINAIIGVASAASLLAACGGTAGTEDGESVADDASADVAAAGAPSAESIDTLDGTKLADFTGDAAKGEKVYLQCKSCHVLEEGQHRIGPSLAGILGKTAGKIENFDYSPANANSGITWTPEKMFQYLEKPQRIIPGTKMAYPGLSDPQKRADLIAYLGAAGE